MVQLSITKEATPAQLRIDVTQDPYDPADVCHISAVVGSAAGSILTAHTIHLRGIEQDLMDTAVEVIVNSYRWGNPALDLAPAMRRVKREATRHARAHERR